jgi:lysine N6-hydroxylase
MTEEVYDLVGIGVGPFNLGLAALLDDTPADLDVCFLEQKPMFNWHGGMLIEETTLEVPFLADLVTMVDPANEYSYLNYLHEKNRLYEFFFYEEFFIPRREYNAYCQWVAEQLSSLQFNRRVTEVSEQNGTFEITTIDPETGTRRTVVADNLVMGIGTQPQVPDQFERELDRDVFHSASYLHRRERCLDADSVTIVGSGQSAAEVFRDLLDRQPDNEYSLDWITRSRGFFQMADAKLGHMIYTPDYIDFFYGLEQSTKDELLERQDLLYKGIDKHTSAKIYDLLYQHSIGNNDPDVGLLAATEVTAIGTTHDGSDNYQLICTQWQEQKQFLHESDVVILATGYTRQDPPFLSPLEDQLQRDEQGRLSVTRDFRLETNSLDGEIFVQNAELHSHGINAPDLGLGPYRNAVIIDAIADGEHYSTKQAETFQSFTTQEFVENRSGARYLPTSSPGIIDND